jgi:glycosyltransferase involved in cell wall biosynthesis
MLNSIKSVIDCAVFVYTGSTDGTQDIIKKWGEANNIPCFVYERPFDNFENSRNYAMQMVKDKSQYAFWLDADETLEIDYKYFADDYDKEKEAIFKELQEQLADFTYQKIMEKKATIGENLNKVLQFTPPQTGIIWK